jgi:predicted MFS family arabinose efflux permease
VLRVRAVHIRAFLFSPEFQQEFALSTTWSGVIGSGSYVGYCLAIALSSILTPRWGPRRVAVLAGLVATAGMSAVAAAPSALVLAAGILIAGSSTGIASPPLAAAVGRWIRQRSQDRAQTLVNAGTGVGVLVSGPVALVLLGQWRWAWAVFAIGTALVTWWVCAAVPSGSGRTNDQADAPRHRRPAGSAVLIAGSLVIGVSSIAVWTFGRELIIVEGHAGGFLASVMWMLIGAAGVAGALSGPLVQHVGIRASWIVLMIALGLASAGLAVAPATAWVVATAAAVFGATYIAITGVVLVWATRLYPGEAAFGVGLAFFMIAAGQAIGAPLVGAGADQFGLSPAFYLCAAIALAGAALGAFVKSPMPT